MEQEFHKDTEKEGKDTAVSQTAVSDTEERSIDFSPDLNTKKKGVAALKESLKTIPFDPGVYRMLDENGKTLYIGKALSLHKRVSSYTRLNQLPVRLKRMVSQIARVEVVITRTEAEALLLEANFIQKTKPYFNILLKDDRSYPWITLFKNHPYPRIARHRGKRNKGDVHWGPFASASAAEQLVQTLQKTFRIRTCTDTVFKTRDRPCLLYQIKRCSGPCVGRIPEEEYMTDTAEASAFLSGKTHGLKTKLQRDMATASENLEFERAAILRDRIKAFDAIKSSNVVNPDVVSDADIISLATEAGKTCVQVFMVRSGRNNGHRAFYPVHSPEDDEDAIMSAFIAQFYDDKVPPKEIIIAKEFADMELIQEALSITRGSKVTFIIPQRGEKKALIDHTSRNAEAALARHLAQEANQRELQQRLTELCGLKAVPQRIEIYDNSHLMGKNPYGVMVVAGPEGFVKAAYRQFSIKSEVTPGDDFGMMKEVMRRRFAHINLDEKVDPDCNTTQRVPDLLLIDGGKGQVSAVKEILSEYGLLDVIPVLGIAKGVDRNAGREWFFIDGKEPFQLPPRDPVLYYLQRLRDESHRFAIGTHRAARGKALTHSRLEDVPGIGSVRRKALIKRFGSVKRIGEASFEALCGVEGISQTTAQQIYDHFHPQAEREQPEDQ